MKLRKKLASFTLRNAVRLAWALAGAAAALGDLGERLEHRVEAQAARHGIDILAAIEPVVQARVAA